MVDPGLVNYVARLRSEGKSDEEIRQSLSNAHWGEQTITVALEMEDSGTVHSDAVTAINATVTESSAKPTIFATITVIVAILIGGLMYQNYQATKLARQFDLAVSYTCAAMSAAREIHALNADGSNLTVGQLQTFLVDVADELEPVRLRHNITREQLVEEIRNLEKPLEDEKFSHAVAEAVAARKVNGSCI